MDEELKGIVQRMIDAKEPEENIAKVIQAWGTLPKKENEVSGQGSQNTSVTSTEPSEPSQNLRGYVDEEASIQAFNEIQNKQALKNSIQITPEDTPETATEKTNYAWELLQSVNNGVNQLVSSASKLPAFIYQIAAIPQNMVVEALGRDDLRVEGDFSNPISNFIEPYIEEHTAGIQAKYGTSVTDLFSKGEYLNGAKLLGNQVAESLPFMAAIGATGGGAAANLAIGGALSADKYAEIQNSEVSDPLKLTNALITGYSELAFERVGTGSILRTAEKIFKDSGKEAAETFAKKTFTEVYETALKKYFPITAPLAEGLEEMATQFTQNVTDRITGVSPDIDLSTGLFDSFVVGAAAGSAISTPVSIANRIVNKSAKSRAEELVKENEIIAQLSSEELSPEEATILGDKFRANNEEVNDILKDDRTKKDNLTPEQTEQAATIQERIDAIDKITSKENIGNELKSSLNQEREGLETQMESIVSESPAVETDGENIVDTYLNRLTEAKQESPSEFWTVDVPSREVLEEAASEGRIVDINGGMGVVDSEGNMFGLFKYDDSAKGTAKSVQEERIKLGGIKTDTFDTENARNYEQQGFKVVSRTPFDESMAPEGWNESEHGRPDVVAMIYDSNNELEIEEQTFDTYDEAIAYRDSFVEQVRDTTPESTPTVDLTTVEDFTPEDTARINEVLSTREKITKRKEELGTSIRDYWEAQKNLGVSNQPIQDSADFIKFTKDLVEYAALTIAEGTIKTAEEFRNFIGADIDPDITNNAFDKAQKAFVEKQVREATVKPKQTVKQTIAKATEGKIKGKVTITEKQALTGQLRTLQKGIREGIVYERTQNKVRTDKVNEAKKTVKDFIKSYTKSGLFKGAKVPASMVDKLVSQIDRLNTETAVYNFSEYLEKVVADVEHYNKVNKARSIAGALDRASKSSLFKKQSTIKPLIRQLIGIGKSPQNITDINAYIALAEGAIDTKGNITVSNKDLENYIQTELETQQDVKDKREAEISEFKKEQELAYIQELMEDAGIEGNPEEYWETLHTYDDSTSLKELEEKSTDEKSKLAEELETIIKASRKNLPTEKGLTPYEVEVLTALKNISLDDLSVAELRNLNTLISNAVVNGDLITGTPTIVQQYNALTESSEWLTEYKDKLKSITNATSQRWFKLAPTKQKLDTRQLFTGLSSAREIGESLYNYILGEVNRGYIRAKTFIDSSVGEAISIYDRNKLKGSDSFDVGVAQYLLNYETDGMWTSEQESFEVKKDMVRQSVELLRGSVAQRKDNITTSERRQKQTELKNLENTYKKIQAFDTYEDFRDNFLNPKQKQLYDHIIKTYDKIQEKSRVHFQKLGVKFTESDLYAPISYNRVVNPSITEDLEFGIDRFYRPTALDSEGKFVAERQNVRQLPQRKVDGNDVQMYLNLDAIRNFDRELSRRIIDIETLDSRIKAKFILANKEVKDALNKGGEVSNHETIVEKTSYHIRDLNGISGFIKDYNHSLDNIISLATRQFYRGSVGSITQTINQSLPNMPSIIARTSFGSFTKSIGLVSNNETRPKLFELIRSSESSAYIRLNDSAEQRMQNIVSDISSDIESDLAKGLVKVDRKIADIIYAGLRGGDNFNTINAWTSAYIESLVNQGVIKSPQGFTNTVLDEQVANPNKKAQDFADNVTSAINATVSKASRAESTKSRSSSQRVLNALFNPLKSFATSQNMEARIAFRNIMRGEGTTLDNKIILGYLGNVMILANLTRYMWSVGFQAVGQGASALILGGDDDREKADERRLKDLEMTKEEEDAVKLNRKIISMLAQNVISTIAFGSSPTWMQEIGEAGVDLVYTKLVVANFNEKTKKEQARNILPQTLLYTSSDNVFGAGVLDQGVAAFSTLDKMFTGAKPIDEDAALKLQTIRVLNVVGQTGLAGADFKRLVQQTTIDMEKVVKDGYYSMSKSYGVIKEAVNKYGIKPIKPFSDRNLYLANEDETVVEKVPLDEDETFEINKAVGKKMIELLDSYGYGKSVKTFNKENRSVEDIDYDMSAIRKEALEEVIFERYKKYKVTESRYNNTIQEEE